MAGNWVVTRTRFKAYGGKTDVIGNFQSLGAARKASYNVIADSKNEKCTIHYLGKKNTVEVGEVLMHHAGYYEGKRFFYPDYYGYYKNKGNKTHWHKYILKADGTLGQGMW